MLFVLFIWLHRCTATNGLTHSTQLKRSNISSLWTNSKSLLGKSNAQKLDCIYYCIHHLTLFTHNIPNHLFLSLTPTGILKFHEVYLGEGVSEGGSDFQDGGGSGVVGGSSLEQHIASAREALGVESYYSRWDMDTCTCWFWADQKKSHPFCSLFMQQNVFITFSFFFFWKW